ncbi:MAG: histidinol-phosphate transaminase [Deltaproteobacteria bacterium]|nr:histidinol-phosphate transaminase [Deltaproteobacteria bacterium]
MLKVHKPLKLTVPDNIGSLVPYPPGKPIEELERELGIIGSIKLASNENPLGPSKKALDAVSKALPNLHRYPDGSCYYLKEKLSSAVGVDPSMLIFGNGSNEIIELLARAFLRADDEAVMGDPSFAVYPIVVKCMGGVSKLVPLTNMKHDLFAMSREINERTRIVFIANPNNPTGTINTASEFSRFMKDVPDDVIVCVDEAYFEFVRSSEYPESLAYIAEGRPVLVLRTFSKIYGLAGLRIGYGIAHPELIGFLNRVRQPFNVNSLAQAAAIAALDDREHLRRTRENNETGLKFLFREVRALGCECVETEANFFLIKVGDGKKVYDALLKKGVIVRPMASYNLPEYIRVTVGLPEENERFLKTFAESVR